MDELNTTTQAPRIVDGRGRDFFTVDNPVIDEKIEQVEAKRRADAGWIYTILCRLASNETGEATLRISYLERKTGRSKPTIIEALKELKRVGLLGVSRNREDGRQGPSTYTILSVPRVNSLNSEPGVQSKNGEGSRVKRFNRITKTVSTKTNTLSNESDGTAPPEASPQPSPEAPPAPHVMKNPFGFFCLLATQLDIIITPEDRQNTAKHFKDLLRLQEPDESEMKKVVSKMLEARTSGFDMSPQKALDKVRNGNVVSLPRRGAAEDSSARPKKRVIS